MGLLLFGLVFTLIVSAVTIYSLINALRGNIRLLERERNVHNAQVGQLLDRIAFAEGRPWNLPDREVDKLPDPLYDPDEDTELQTHWREV